MKFSNDSVIRELLEEYKKQRDALKEMISDIEQLKKRIDSLFPDTLNKRYVRFFEEKVKTATGMFNVLLDMRKELTKNLKEEIEIRSKLDNQIDAEDLDKIYNIRALAKKVEVLKKQKDIFIEKTDEQINEL
jgi:hypothetical protein